MNIKLITFKTNHTIMGEMISENDTSIKIKHCVQVVMVPPSAQNTQGGVAFSPFIEYAEEFKTGFEIKKEKRWNTVIQNYEFRKVGILNDSMSIILNSFQNVGDSVTFYYFVKK